MKSIVLILIYIASFFGFYLVLSLAGLIWYPYLEVIKNPAWVMIYSLLIGWWVASFPAREYYIKHASYFAKIF